MVALEIKKYIDDHGIKQSVIAAKAGLTDVQLSAYLTGRIRLPADVFFTICAALEQSPERFAPNKKELR